MNSQYSHRVYLDHAATTPVRTEVSSVVSETMDSFYGNPSSIYREGQDAKRLLEESRDSVANFLNATGKRDLFYFMRHRIGQLGNQGSRAESFRSKNAYHNLIR